MNSVSPVFQIESSKYNGFHHQSIIPPLVNVVIRNVHPGIARALANYGSMSSVGKNAIEYYLKTVKRVNVENIKKSKY
jgi:hypothetical protein